MLVENKTTEFKREYVNDIKNTIVAFANCDGGTLYIGVNDDGTACGVDDVDDTMLRVTNAIRDAVRPDITMFIECKNDIMNEKPIVCITVQRGTARPYYLQGNVDTTPMTRRLSLSYAKVSVIHNTKENFMPVFEGSPVYTADNNDIEIALGLDNIDEKTAIPAGLMKASNNVSVPIKYNGDFLIGPEGAHMNISGISGLATKTSYIMFLLKAIQYKYKDDVAIIVMNVKGDDLLHIHQKNEKITETQRSEWDTLGVPCEPFENVKYLYPYRNQKDRLYANTALSVKELGEQYAAKQADNFIYTFEHDIDKIDMLFSNVDDPNYTIESILNRIDDGPEFKGVSSWDDLKEQLKEFGTKGNGKSSASGILFQSWQRFRRLINNSINDDVFVNAKSMSNDLHQVYLSDEILNMNGGEMRVVDIAGLTEQLQCLVFGDIIRSVYALKHGD